MDIKKYEALLTAINEGTFTKAAEKLGYTQSGLTHMMNSLEKEIGFTVLTRGRYGIKPTENGEKILPAIKNIVKSSNALDASVKKILNCSKNILKIGIHSSIAPVMIGDVLCKFKSEFKNIHTNIICSSAKDTYNWEANGLCDIVITTEGENKTVNRTVLYSESIYAILNKNTVSKAPFDLYNLDAQSFIMPYSSFDKDLFTLFNKLNIHPQIQKTNADDSTIISMVESGMGITLMGGLTALNTKADVNVLPLKQKVTRTVCASVNPNMRSNAAATGFVRIVSEFFNSYKIE